MPRKRNPGKRQPKRPKRFSVQHQLPLPFGERPLQPKKQEKKQRPGMPSQLPLFPAEYAKPGEQKQLGRKGPEKKGTRKAENGVPENLREYSPARLARLKNLLHLARAIDAAKRDIRDRAGEEQFLEDLNSLKRELKQNPEFLDIITQQVPGLKGLLADLFEQED